jgi:hypothetical protein
MPDDSQTRTCPYCKEEIRVDAVKCKHCHSMLADRPGHGGTCPLCKEEIHPEAIRCKHCHANLARREGLGGGCGCGQSALRARQPRMRAGQPRITMRRVGVLDNPFPPGSKDPEDEICVTMCGEFCFPDSDICIPYCADFCF